MEAAEEQMTIKEWLGVFGVILGAFMAVLDIQITNASIQAVTGGLGATIEDGSWISTAYLAAEIIIIPLSGWLSRVLSLKTYLLWTTACFTFFSICCGYSWNLPSMIVFRALQGFTGGALIPLAFQVIFQMPTSKRTIGMSLFAITATFAPAIGPTIGGYLTETFNWPVIFFMNVLPGIIMLAIVTYATPSSPADRSLLKSIDLPGILTMAVGLAALTVFLEEGQRKDWFASNLITSLGITAAIFITSFLIIELKVKEPFINLRLLLQRNFGLGSVTNFVVGIAMYGALYLLPLYLSTVQGYNSLQIGETMIWSGLPQLLILPFVPQILKRFDSRWVAFVGIVIFGVSCLMNNHLDIYVGMDQLLWSQLVRSLGQPILMVPLSTITMGLVASEQSGSASGLFNMLRNLGGSVGIAMLSTVFTIREQFHSAKIGEGVTIFSPQTQHRLSLFKSVFVAHGMDATIAAQKAMAALDATVRQQAYIMSFNDCFLIVGIALVASSGLILLCAKVSSSSSVAAH